MSNVAKLKKQAAEIRVFALDTPIRDTSDRLSKLEPAGQ